MYMFILLVMVFIASTIVIIVGLNTDEENKVVIWLFGGFTIIIIGFYTYAKMTCGPNYFDVRVMKPMAEKISDYIVKNGIPKSLKDIPNLPYELERCQMKTNQDSSRTELCSINNYIEVIFDYGEFAIDKINYKEAHLEMKNYVSKTGLLADFTNNDNSSFILDGEIGIYSSKTSAICNSMRQ